MASYEYGKLSCRDTIWYFNGTWQCPEEMDVLNHLGSEGWELVTSYISSDNWPVHMLRREVTIEA